VEWLLFIIGIIFLAGYFGKKEEGDAPLRSNQENLEEQEKRVYALIPKDALLKKIVCEVDPKIINKAKCLEDKWARVLVEKEAPSKEIVSEGVPKIIRKTRHDSPGELAKYISNVLRTKAKCTEHGSKIVEGKKESVPEFEQSYITHATCKLIVATHVNVEAFKSVPADDLYKVPLDVLSSREKTWLVAYRTLFETPSLCLEYAYSPQSKPLDTGRYVYPPQRKAFHSYKDCRLLKNDYENYEVPVEIYAEPGRPRLARYRKWFIENQELFFNDQELFLKRMEAKFFLKNPPKFIQKPNSGIKEKESINLETIESSIDEILAVMNKKKNSQGYEGDAIRKYGDLSHLKRDDKSLARILDVWRGQKRDLKKYLLVYFRIKFNPEMKFERNFLEQLGFKFCAECHGKQSGLDSARHRLQVKNRVLSASLSAPIPNFEHPNPVDPFSRINESDIPY